MSVVVVGGEERARRSSSWIKPVLAAAALIALAIFLWSVWDHQAVMEWTRRARPIPFFSLMAILPAFGAPITPFFVIAGATFGATRGLAGSMLALAVNLTLCYAAARALRPIVKRLLRRFGYELPNVAERRKGSVRFTLAVKLAPGVPAFIKHYVLGVAGVPFALYLGLSLLVTGTYAALFVFLGESLLLHDRRRTLIAAAVLGVIALGVCVWRWRRRLARA